ncbi:MAG: ribonuclease H-like domain-containing protein [Methanobacterium sp.]|uniref:ribonuclease H-like domain-containing protein n=1 Tax=Methanobacterium sp. TaxID=2164 RepID=UPI003D65CBE4|nr:ribonuclease H-like domain-containing protein [Methanobacterium sp.]
MEYENAIKLKEKLLKNHQEMALEDIITGKEINTEKGTCYSIENKSKLKLNKIDSRLAKERILSDLKLLNGIGCSKEEKLKEKGYNTIEDLKDHDGLNNDALEFLKIFEDNPNCNMTNLISRWYSKSHPLVLFSSSFWNDEDFIFLDIETLGLSNKPIILLGVAKVSGSEITVNQYLSRSLNEEDAVIDAFLSGVESESVFVTFNGQTFDLPFILNRMRHFNIKKEINNPHFDMLHFSRREWSSKLPNCKLTTLEKHLFNIGRDDDVPSALVPEFYQTYLKTGNIGPLVPIVEHNEQDIITLAMLFSKLHENYANNY